MVSGFSAVLPCWGCISLKASLTFWAENNSLILVNSYFYIPFKDKETDKKSCYCQKSPAPKGILDQHQRNQKLQMWAWSEKRGELHRSIYTVCQIDLWWDWKKKNAELLWPEVMKQRGGRDTTGRWIILRFQSFKSIPKSNLCGL